MGRWKVDLTDSLGSGAAPHSCSPGLRGSPSLTPPLCFEELVTSFRGAAIGQALCTHRGHQHRHLATVFKSGRGLAKVVQ